MTSNLVIFIPGVWVRGPIILGMAKASTQNGEAAIIAAALF
jgi:hypothetical protein